MTDDNDQTLVRPQGPALLAGQPAGADLSTDDLLASLDAQTIAQSDLGLTIKQEPAAAQSGGAVWLAEDGANAQTIAQSPASLPSPDVLAQENLDATLIRPAPAAAATSELADDGSTVAQSFHAAGDDEGATLAQTAPTPSGTPSAQHDSQAFRATVLRTAGATGVTAAVGATGATGSAGSAGVRTGDLGGSAATSLGRSQGASGRSQSVSLRMGSSAVSINIHPRTIVKSAGGSGLKYAAQPELGGGVTDFELLEQLGEGGMGVVYSARQSSIDRPVALKMIKGDALTKASARAKFLQEAVVTGDLDHPNIVTVYDLGADVAGNVFYAMKKVVGVEWSKVLKTKSRRENLDILLRVCDAVAFAHSRGVIHRDLKPENTMLGSFGEVLVMDWGLAVAVNERGKAERIGSGTGICGTPAYLAPEMAAPGRWREIGFGSDIYLLGAMLFEILTGLRPHNGRNVGECLRNAARNVIRETGVTGELMEIARQAMADTPVQRYATVQDLQGAIREHLAHSESVLLGEKAQADLQLAQTTRQHEDYAKALFGFRQAFEMWAGNHQAQAGLVEAVRLYATAAMESGDLDLAFSLVSRDNFPACAALKEQIEAALRHREEQKRRNHRLRVGVIVLSAAVLVVAVVAALWINRERVEANRQRVVAEIACVEADTQRVKAEKALGAEIAARAAEKVARQGEKKAQAEAKESREVIQKRDELAANAWWHFSPEAALKQRDAAATDAQLPAVREVRIGKEGLLKLSLIPAGTFGMGSPAAENGRLSEENLHRVRISHPFYLAQTELTLGQFKALGGTLPPEAAQASPDLPAAGVSWNEATKNLLPALNKYAPAGWVFRLPTEAQWEWACRAGSNAEYYSGDGDAALRKAGVSGEDNLGSAGAVGKRAPNAWGLFDMHGNLAEWCEDLYSKDAYFTDQPLQTDPVQLTGDLKRGKRVVRGGSWTNQANQCRSAYRSNAGADSHYQFVGVRVALVRADAAAAKTDAEPMAVPPADRAKP